jgi:outer membrane putative beta-barrel porin/alpha-amylase
MLVNLIVILALAGAIPEQQQGQQPASSAETIDADRPHVGTGTHVVPPGEVQLELGGQWQRSTGVRSFASPALVRTGVSDRIEARIASDGILIRDVSGKSEQGIGNVQFGVKVRLLGGVEEPYFSVMPLVNVGLASYEKGLGSGANDVSITMLAGHALGRGFHGETNYGLAAIGDSAGRFAQHLITGAVVHQSTPRLQTYVEAAWWSRTEHAGTAVSFIDYGAILSVAPRFLIDAGAFSGLTTATPDYGFFTGLSFVVGTSRAHSHVRRFPL